MKVCAIICEYNPFHAGHAWHIAETRRLLGEDTAVIAVMSGNFVQRGEFALFEKYTRAFWAVCGGADLVLELPVVYALSSAERFAMGGVRLAGALGMCEYLSFGCEAGSLPGLAQAAAVLSEGGVQREIVQRMADGRPYAAARQAILSEKAGKEVAGLLSHPNNILAVEYLRAIKMFGPGLAPVAVPRKGGLHDGGPQGGFASASYIRAGLAGENPENVRPYLPDATAEEVYAALSGGQGACPRLTQRAVLARLRAMEETAFARLPDATEGLDARLFRAVREGKDLGQIVSFATTKRYPAARIRRMLMAAYLGIFAGENERQPAYTLALAFNRKGRSLLKTAGKSGEVPVIARPAAAKSLPAAALRSFKREMRAEDLWRLALDTDDLPGGAGWKRTPVFVDR